ncbi:MAG: GntR family transcriptional regulator [Solirubrobacteraceae bacterium]
MSTLDLSIDRDSDLPLATQLAWKLRTLIATGQLAPGSRLPGVREVAAAAQVNVNTVRAVYRRLEQDALIHSEHGRGTFVADRAAAQRELASIAADAATRARSAGVDPRDVAAAMFVHPDAAVDPSVGREPPGSRSPTQAGARPRRDARAHRRELRAEIAALERELAYVEGATGEPASSGGRGQGHILGTAELESVRDRLRERLADRRQDAEALRRRLIAARHEAAEPATRAPVGRRAWAHTGVSTGRLAPGVAGVVWTSGS